MTEQATRLSRRVEQRRQRRRRQVQLTAALLSVLVVLAAAFAIALARDAPDTAGPDAGPVERTQRTLLLQVLGPNGAGIAHALLAHDPAAQEGAVVLVPPQVIVSLPSAGAEQLGRAILTVPAESLRNALGDLLGVTVDEHWVMSEEAFVALVDALGGIPVEVDVPVVRGASVVVQPGRQDLDGARAYAFLTYLAPGEQEQVRLARVQEVLDGIVNVLPSTADDLTQVLQRLGQRSAASLPLPELAALLIGLATDDEAGQLQYDSLPVADVEAGGGVVAFRVDAEAARALVDRLLAASVPPGVREGGNRVLVFNGVGTPGLGEAVRQRLVPAGFVLVDSRNADRFGYARTQILVPEATPEAQALGERVARAIGLPDAVVTTQDLGTTADVAVLVGADFRR